MTCESSEGWLKLLGPCIHMDDTNEAPGFGWSSTASNSFNHYTTTLVPEGSALVQNPFDIHFFSYHIFNELCEDPSFYGHRNPLGQTNLVLIPLFPWAFVRTLVRVVVRVTAERHFVLV